MKIAARFPVKSEPWYLLGICLVHLLIFSLAIFSQFPSWLVISVVLSLLFSLYYSIIHYRLLTQAPDDLCWSGENWLLKEDSRQARIIYLELQEKSWISSFGCLLHFSCNEKKYRWLFSRHRLGQRAYSELCFLAKQTIKAKTKNTIA